MKLTEHSQNRMRMTASHWSVARDYFDPLYNYLVHGLEPGSFWSAVLANDFWRAIQSSHPGNDIPALKNVVGWMRDSFPQESFGSYEHVQAWLAMSEPERRARLEQAHLIYTEQQEIMLLLKGETLPEPVLY